MNAFEYGEISQRQAESGKLYLQFLNEGTMSLGLYALVAGSTDTQSPHTEDEIYYVVAGRGAIVVAGERRPVQSGSIVFVAKRSNIALSTSKKTSRCWSSSPPNTSPNRSGTPTRR